MCDLRPHTTENAARTVLSKQGSQQALGQLRLYLNQHELLQISTCVSRYPRCRYINDAQYSRIDYPHYATVR